MLSCLKLFTYILFILSFIFNKDNKQTNLMSHNNKFTTSRVYTIVAKNVLIMNNDKSCYIVYIIVPIGLLPCVGICGFKRL